MDELSCHVHLHSRGWGFSVSCWAGGQATTKGPFSGTVFSWNPASSLSTSKSTHSRSNLVEATFFQVRSKMTGEMDGSLAPFLCHMQMSVACESWKARMEKKRDLEFLTLRMTGGIFVLKFYPPYPVVPPINLEVAWVIGPFSLPHANVSGLWILKSKDGEKARLGVLIYIYTIYCILHVSIHTKTNFINFAGFLLMTSAARS